jgi:hypothetical protein
MRVSAAPFAGHASGGPPAAAHALASGLRTKSEVAARVEGRQEAAFSRRRLPCHCFTEAQDAVKSTVWRPPPATGCPITIIRGRTTMSIEARTTGLRLGAIGIGLAGGRSRQHRSRGRPQDRLHLVADRRHRRLRQGRADGWPSWRSRNTTTRAATRARRSKPSSMTTRPKPAKGVENVTRLITRDKVFAMVGPVNSGVALAII